jgi:hypothetical protein
MLKKLIIGLVVAFAMVVPATPAGAHYNEGEISGWVEAPVSPGPWVLYGDTLGHGNYRGHSHAKACLNVTLQQKVGSSSYIAVGNVAQDCEQPNSDGALSAVSRAQDCAFGPLDAEVIYRVKVRFRSWGPAGTPTADVTRYVGQNGILWSCYP